MWCTRHVLIAVTVVAVFLLLAKTSTFSLRPVDSLWVNLDVRRGGGRAGTVAARDVGSSGNSNSNSSSSSNSNSNSNSNSRVHSVMTQDDHPLSVPLLFAPRPGQAVDVDADGRDLDIHRMEAVYALREGRHNRTATTMKTASPPYHCSRADIAYRIVRNFANDTHSALVADMLFNYTQLVRDMQLGRIPLKVVYISIDAFGYRIGNVFRQVLTSFLFALLSGRALLFRSAGGHAGHKFFDFLDDPCWVADATRFRDDVNSTVATFGGPKRHSPGRWIDYPENRMTPLKRMMASGDLSSIKQPYVQIKTWWDLTPVLCANERYHDWCRRFFPADLPGVLWRMVLQPAQWVRAELRAFRRHHFARTHTTADGARGGESNIVAVHARMWHPSIRVVTDRVANRASLWQCIRSVSRALGSGGSKDGARVDTVADSRVRDDDARVFAFSDKPRLLMQDAGMNATVLSQLVGKMGWEPVTDTARRWDAVFSTPLTTNLTKKLGAKSYARVTLAVLMEAFFGATCTRFVSFMGSSMTHFVYAYGSLPYYDHHCTPHRNTASLDMCMIGQRSGGFSSTGHRPVFPFSMLQVEDPVYMYWCSASSRMRRLPLWVHKWGKPFGREKWRQFRNATTPAERGEWGVRVMPFD